jgi:hypothetical protein
MAYKVFSNGSVLNASDLNDYLMNQSVMVFSSAATRTTALTAPLEGMLTWLEDTNVYQYWNGSAWTNLIPTSSSGLVHIRTFSFTGSSSESVNNVFSSTYDNYLILGEGTNSANDYINFRMRVGGVDNSTASSYITQLLETDNATVTGSRVTQTSGRISRWSSGTGRTGFTAWMYDPFVAVETSVRSNEKRQAVPILGDFATHHTQAVSYDGITFFPTSGTMTGSISIYGLAKA